MCAVASVIIRSQTSRGTEARSAYRRTSSDCAASARWPTDLRTSGHR